MRDAAKQFDIGRRPQAKQMLTVPRQYFCCRYLLFIGSVFLCYFYLQYVKMLFSQVETIRSLDGLNLFLSKGRTLVSIALVPSPCLPLILLNRSRKVSNHCCYIFEKCVKQNVFTLKRDTCSLEIQHPIFERSSLF